MKRFAIGLGLLVLAMAGGDWSAFAGSGGSGSTVTTNTTNSITVSTTVNPGNIFSSQAVNMGVSSFCFECTGQQQQPPGFYQQNNVLYPNDVDNVTYYAGYLWSFNYQANQYASNFSDASAATANALALAIATEGASGISEEDGNYVFQDAALAGYLTSQLNIVGPPSSPDDSYTYITSIGYDVNGSVTETGYDAENLRLLSQLTRATTANFSRSSEYLNITSQNATTYVANYVNQTVQSNYQTNSTSNITTLSGVPSSIHANTQTTNVSDQLTLQVGGTLYSQDVTVQTSPIVMDLEGKGNLEASGGIWLPHASSWKGKYGVVFDLFGDGFPIYMEWVGPHDGLLCVPKADGTVDGTGLFGDMDGYPNGYAKLATLDTNHDGKLTGSELKALYVWQDKNENGKVDPGELTPVTSLGITEIGISHDTKLVGYFVMNGQRHLMWDWYPNGMELHKMKSL